MPYHNKGKMKMMKGKMKINAIVLFIRNFEACEKFYREILGLKIKSRDVGFISFELEGDQELALMSLDAASQMISKKAIQPSQKSVPRTLLAIFVEDTDKSYEELKARGVEFVKPPTTQPWGQRTAYFRDPDGNLWEISHFITEKK
jgi:catechol 2,3-dioxygenase-like lactoylglutathione lyase family enzyme